MDERPDQIERHIHEKRNELGSNLHEFQSKVKSVTDWRLQFRKHPWAMIGLAFGGGVAISTMIGGRNGRYSSQEHWTPRKLSSESSDYSTGRSTVVRQEKRKAAETMDHVKAALIGFAAAKAKEMLTDYLPGFREHLNRTEREAASSQQSTSQSNAQQGSGYQRPQTQPM